MCCGAGGRKQQHLRDLHEIMAAERCPTSTGTPILLNVAGTTVQVLSSLPPAAVRSQVKPCGCDGGYA